MVHMVISGAALSLATLILVLVVGLKRSNHKLEEQLRDLSARMDLLVHKQGNATSPQGFSAHLKTVEQAQKVDSKPAAQADKYRYAVAMAAQGYTSEGIANALQMAQTEVEQIMHLSRVKQS